MAGRLFVAEKPSVAQAIAENLGPTPKRGASYWSVGSDYVVWLYGHVIRLYEADEYDSRYRFWAIADLPIFPTEWKFKVLTGRDDAPQRQVDTIARLAKEVGSIVIASDPDREGQLLGQEVLEFLGITEAAGFNIERMLPNANDPVSIKRALAAVCPNSRFQHLFDAGIGRSRSDWLIGINMTRAVTKTYVRGKGFISIGRVQTPTLALVVARDRQIENFGSRNFWNLIANVVIASGKLRLEYAPRDEDKRLWSQKEAEDILAIIQGKRLALKVARERKAAAPPALFTLPTLQKLANKEWKFSAQKTLDLAQKLYDKKFLTYPRTECPNLPSSQLADVDNLVSAVLSTGVFRRFERMRPLMKPRKSVFDDAKVEEHHAIVPTMRVPDFEKGELSPDEERLWREVAKRYLLMLLPDYLTDQTVVSLAVAGRELTTTGIVPVNYEASWQYGSDQRIRQVLLPPVADGEMALVESTRASRGTTTPPAYYTEGTLLADMGAVAKYVTDEKLKRILTETSGIGTAATQASTIELLKSRGYIQLTEDSTLRASSFARQLIDALPPMLYDPGLTALIEDALKDVQAGRLELEEFTTRSERFVKRRIEEVVAMNGRVRLQPPAAEPSDAARPTPCSSAPKRQGSGRPSCPKTASAPRARKAT